MAKRQCKILELPVSEIAKWNDLMDAEFVNYDTWGFAPYSTVFWRTVTFDDGFEMDLKVNTSRKDDGDVWCEAVLFAPEGFEVAHSDVDWELDGEWSLWHDTDEYVVQVKRIEEE